MRFVSLVLAFLIATIVPLGALEPANTAQNAVTAWQDWMARNKIKQGAMVVYFDGKPLLESAINRTVDEPAKLASLSKAITAVCTLKALDKAGKTTKLSLGDVLPDLFAKYSPSDTRLANVTVGQLITHRSGLQSRYHRGIEVLRTFKKENKPWQFSKIASETLVSNPGSAQFHYNNSNYLILGLVIEALSNEDYDSYCQSAVLTPAGVTTAKLNETWRVMSSWGGWEMSAADYMRFAQTYFANGNHINAGTGQTLVTATVRRGRSYGPGVLFQRSGTGTTIWHNGSWRWKGRLSDKFGTYFALYDNGFAVSVNFAHDAYDEWGDLDAALWKATHPK